LIKFRDWVYGFTTAITKGRKRKGEILPVGWGQKGGKTRKSERQMGGAGGSEIRQNKERKIREREKKTGAPGGGWAQRVYQTQLALEIGRWEANDKTQKQKTKTMSVKKM